MMTSNPGRAVHDEEAQIEPNRPNRSLHPQPKAHAFGHVSELEVLNPTKNISSVREHGPAENLVQRKSQFVVDHKQRVASERELFRDPVNRHRSLRPRLFKTKASQVVSASRKEAF